MIVPPSPSQEACSKREVASNDDDAPVLHRPIRVNLPLGTSDQNDKSEETLNLINILRDSFIIICDDRIEQWIQLLNRAINAKQNQGIDCVEEQLVLEALQGVKYTLKHSQDNFSHKKMKVHFVESNSEKSDHRQISKGNGTGDLIQMAAKAITSMRNVTNKREKGNVRGSPPLKKRLRPSHLSSGHKFQKPTDGYFKNPCDNVLSLIFEVTLQLSLPGFEVLEVPLRALGETTMNASLSGVESHSGSRIEFLLDAVELLKCMKSRCRKIVRTIAETVVLSVRSKYESPEEIESSIQSTMPPPPPRKPQSSQFIDDEGVNVIVATNTIPSTSIAQHDSPSHFPSSPPASRSRKKLPVIVSPPLCDMRSAFSKSPLGDTCTNFSPVSEVRNQGKEMDEEFLFKTVKNGPCMPSLSSNSSPSDVEETVRALASLKYTQVCNFP
mmetsp:Transcript_38970/g.45385  ORF Transcript_38970/g.45385 Transcript_38970/m.45385 type:complete len:441 (+) Transcript_38970:119-1441(+)|eukprot:CAMPEP_0194378236 /NCGR_PEP_ID=MMETSP0174-20130528/34461_1 /TAXON_ID=216777 /ORGANISM="Proboscia alata, Strain PI-D3" /LENGTH=440 /DNA_ID=CAMNT_0039160085 /DNA_START=79 /DNA_END=1401 /DNA_ORIENTATION=-